jgi:hypothetical protein
MLPPNAAPESIAERLYSEIVIEARAQKDQEKGDLLYWDELTEEARLGFLRAVMLVVGPLSDWIEHQALILENELSRSERLREEIRRLEAVADQERRRADRAIARTWTTGDFDEW